MLGELLALAARLVASQVCKLVSRHAIKLVAGPIFVTKTLHNPTHVLLTVQLGVL